MASPSPTSSVLLCALTVLAGWGFFVLPSIVSKSAHRLSNDAWPAIGNVAEPSFTHGLVNLAVDVLRFAFALLVAAFIWIAIDADAKEDTARRAAEKAALEAKKKAEKEAAEKEAAEKAAREAQAEAEKEAAAAAAARATAEEAARRAAEEAAREKAAQEAAREKAAQEAAREKAAQEAAREKAAQEAAREKAAQEAAREKAAQEAAREKAAQEAIEKAEKTKREKEALEAMEKAEKAKREEEAREAKEKAEKEAAEREAAHQAAKEKERKEKEAAAAKAAKAAAAAVLAKAAKEAADKAAREAKIVADREEARKTPVKLIDAMQSSIAFGGDPMRAIDGNTSGVWGRGSVSHTNLEEKPFWRAKFATESTVERVVVYNRTLVCMERIDGAIVRLHCRGAVVATVITPGKSWAVYDSGSDISGVVADMIEVSLPEKNYLSLAEVMVFGTSTC